MEDSVISVCGWRGKCAARAWKHLVAGLRVFDVPQDIHVSDIPYTPVHIDLCEKHAERVRAEYLYTDEYDVGKCPTPHLDALAKARTSNP